MPPPPPHRSGPGPRRSGSLGTTLLSIVIAFAFIFLFVFIANSCDSQSSSTRYYDGNGDRLEETTEVREKLDSQYAFDSDCVLDELGYFESTTKTKKALKTFWTKTGVQPFILLRQYDDSLTTDAQKDQWAEDYYESSFDTREDVFLFVYFAQEDEATATQAGYMAVVNGQQVDSIMDEEALQFFWNYIDRYWYSDMTMDQVFAETYSNTTFSIMNAAETQGQIKSRGRLIGIIVLVIILVLLIGIFIIRAIKLKNKRAKEKAEEDQRILETPLSDITGESQADKLADKYLDDENGQS